jgi:hypothetical protein
LHPFPCEGIPCVFPRSDAPASITGISNAWTAAATTGGVVAAAATPAAAVKQQQQPSLPPPPVIDASSPPPTTQREDFTSVARQPQPSLPPPPPPPPPAVIDASSPAPTTQRMGVFGSNASGTQTAQLTIFYAGTVNVFNDVTQEKAHLIMLLANGGGGGTSWTSAAPAKFISSQGSSSIMSAPPSLMNAVTAKTPVQTVTTPPAANPPPASSSVVSTTTTSAAACAPNVAPPMLLLPSAPQNSAAKLQQQQEYSSLSQLPVLLNMRDTTSLTIVPLSALLPPAAPQGQNISSQGTIISQKQEALLLPELSRVMTAALNVKSERSDALVSLANALSMQAEKNNMGLSAKKGNELQLELLQEAASNPSSCAPAASLNAAMCGSSVCYTQGIFIYFFCVNFIYVVRPELIG